MGKINPNFVEKRSLILEQDLKLIKGLSGNDKKVRDRILRNLKKWMAHRSSKIPFTQEDFVRIWKGLFCAMWMSDKPLVQEQCAEKIAELIHFSDPKTSLVFFKSCLIVLTTEWFGIDQLRLDKFLMLVRRILRQTFEVLKENHWNEDLIKTFGEILLGIVLKTEQNTFIGLTMHITEIYLEELSKVSKGKIDKHLVTELIKPFVKQLTKLSDDRQIKHIQQFLFHHLLEQSDEGIEYATKFHFWKEKGFPGGTIDALEKVTTDDNGNCSDADDNDSDNEETKQLDPRAGYVDVILPQIPFDAQEIANILAENKFSKGSTTKARKVITKLITEFEKLSQGDFPLGMKNISMPEDSSYSTKLKKSVNRLVKFEKELLASSNKNKKKRKLKRKVEDFEVEADNIEIDAGASEMDADDIDTQATEEKLQAFIKKSEGNILIENNILNKKKKKKSNNQINKNISNKFMKKTKIESFQRNSGTWFVEQLDVEKNNVSVLSESSEKKKEISIKTKNIEREKLNSTNNTSNAFPQSEWDATLNEGEYELYIPSNKYKNKIKDLSKKSESTYELINNFINRTPKRFSLNIGSKFDNKIRKKARHSLDGNLVKNPFSKHILTPKSEKKVKIALNLNKCQEIFEHRAQLRSSPGIPYDANKKPSKPLLKSNGIGSPINPFYKKKVKS